MRSMTPQGGHRSMVDQGDDGAGGLLLPGVYPVTDTYGIVNDAPAINAAINSAATAAHPGGVVWIPPGTHRLKSTVHGSAGVRLQGAGSKTVLLVDDSGGNIGDAIVLSDLYRPAISDLTISATAPRAAGTAIHVTGGDLAHRLSAAYPLAACGATIERVDMDTQFNGLLVDNNAPASEWLLNVDNGIWRDFTAGGNGLWLNANSPPGNPGFGASQFFSRLFFYQRTATLIANAVRIQGSGDFNFRECETYGFDHGLVMDPPAGGFVTTGRFLNCFFDVSGHTTALIAPDPAAVFTDIEFGGCWFASSVAEHGLWLSTALAGDIRAYSCMFISNAIFGLVIAGGCKGFQADGCTFAGNQAGGAIATQNVTNFSIRNSKFVQEVYNAHQAQPIGVQVDLGCSEYIIALNNIHDAVTPLVDNGGAVAKIVAPNLL